MIKAIFFDWDDTLNVHDEFKRYGEEAAVHVIEADLIAREIKIDEESIYEAYKNAEAIMFSRKEYNRVSIWKVALKGLDLEMEDETVEKAVEQYWRTIESKSHLVEDAIYVLERLRTMGYKLGIIADYDDHIRDKKGAIMRSPIGSFFDVIVLGGLDHPTTKPDPSIFLHACRKIGCNPSEAVMVGDSVSDVVGARNAGMISILIGRKRAQIANHSIKNLAELVSVLNRINSP